MSSAPCSNSGSQVPSFLYHLLHPGLQLHVKHESPSVSIQVWGQMKVCGGICVQYSKTWARSGIPHLCPCSIGEKTYCSIYLQGGLENVIPSWVATCPAITLLLWQMGRRDFGRQRCDMLSVYEYIGLFSSTLGSRRFWHGKAFHWAFPFFKRDLLVVPSRTEVSVVAADLS